MSLVSWKQVGWEQVGWKALGWKDSNQTGGLSADIALFFRAKEGLRNQVGNKNPFLSNVLGPQYVLNADGSYSNAGAVAPVDVIGGRKMLRTCGAVTNLFSGDTSTTRFVSLTAQAYTLQVFGAGSVSCSYGTATVGSPLTFTAIVGLVTFTPTGATLWMLTATSYPVPYTPPGTTMPASHATTTNGPWFGLPQYDDAPANTKVNRVWAALDGEPDGVELVTNAADREFSSDTSWWIKNGESRISGGVARIYSSAGAYSGIFRTALLTIGQRYELMYDVVAKPVPGGGISDQASTTMPVNIGRNRHVFTATMTNFEIKRTGSACDISIDNISIQRIQPKPMTLAWRGVMGVGSGDTPGNSILSDFSPNGAFSPLFTRNDGSAVYPARGSDGTSVTGGSSMVFQRNSAFLKVLQVNTAGTQFRVGYILEGTHSVIQWSNWVAYDGSFNPSNLYKLMLSYCNIYPMWHDTTALWNKQIDDATLLKEMLK